MFLMAPYVQGKRKRNKVHSVSSGICPSLTMENIKESFNSCTLPIKTDIFPLSVLGWNYRDCTGHIPVAVGKIYPAGFERRETESFQKLIIQLI